MTRRRTGPAPARPRPDSGAPARSATWAWIVYDLANTIFALGVVGLYFPDWMTGRGIADSALAVTQAVAGTLVIVAAPWVGARSDHRGRRVPALLWTTVAAVAATSLLAAGPVPLTFVLLGIALVAVNIGSVVYDALLPDVSTDATRGKVSGLGVGVGYIGSFIGLGLGTLALDVLGWSHAATFRLLAAGFLLFALPAFTLIREPPRPPRPGAAPALRRIVGDLVRSWRRASRLPDVTRFLVSRFLYTDAINTLIGGFLTIYVIEEVGLDRQGATTLIGVAIAAAVVGGFLGGSLVGRLGPRRVLRMVLVMWLAALGAGIAAAESGMVWLAWLIGPVGGLALGGTWTADRVVMIRISPPANLGELYGLYATVGRFATILGPLVWALVVGLLGLGRSVAMAALGLFILAGWWVVGGVDDRIRHWDDRPA